MSTIYTIDWIKFLGQDSEVPPDVTFCVIQSSGTFKVRAHKLVLAAVSSVFRKMFFGDQKFTKEEDEIEITDSECFAFQKMINYIYSKSYSILMYSDIRDSFETLKVGDKYDLTDLVVLSRRAIESFVITSRNVGKVLRVIEAYKTLEGFDTICNDLNIRCRKFVDDNMKTAQDVFNLLAVGNADDDAERSLENELVVKLLKETAKCKFCKMHPSLCLNGQKVTYENMIEGAQQRIRADSTFQSLGNWTTIEKTIGHINAFSKEDSVHYYTPGGMALRYCYKFGAKWNNTGFFGTKEPVLEAHYLEIPDVSYDCVEQDQLVAWSARPAVQLSMQ